MTLDERARAAVDELVGRAAPDPDAMLTALRRSRRRRGVATTVASVLAVLVAVGGGWLAVRPDATPPQPADPVELRNGTLLTTWRGGVDIVSGSSMALPADVEPGSHLEFARSGRELLYQSLDTQVRAIDVRTGESRVLADCTTDPCAFSLSPDGTMLAQPDGPRSTSLRVVELRTGSARQIHGPGPDPTSPTAEDLAPTAPDALPAWSPDGRRIALTTRTGLYVVKADGTELRRLAGFRMPYLLAASWAPDGQRLVHVTGWSEVHGRNPLSTHYAVQRVDLAGGTERRRLLELGSCVCLHRRPPAVVWSPDGRLISGTYTTGFLFELEPDGGGLRGGNFFEPVAGFRLAWQPLPR